MSDDQRWFCFAMAWRRGRRYRVIHWHRPRAGIVTCDRARQVLATRRADDAGTDSA